MKNEIESNLPMIGDTKYFIHVYEGEGAGKRVCVSEDTNMIHSRLERQLYKHTRTYYWIVTTEEIKYIKYEIIYLNRVNCH